MANIIIQVEDPQQQFIQNYYHEKIPHLSVQIIFSPI